LARRASGFRPVVANPARKPLLVDLASGNAADHDDGLGLIGDEIDAVQTEERDDGEERSAFVAVEKG
jgi:hypothetical protein